MADEATPEVEPTPEVTPESTEQKPLEGEQPEPEDEGGKFEPDKALEKIRKLNSEAKNLRERAKAAEDKAAGVDEKDSRIKALEAENLRIRVGARHGLPDALIDRLKGDTEDEILADAEKLLELVTPKRPPTGRPAEKLRGGTEPTREPEETDVSAIGARMFRR